MKILEKIKLIPPFTALLACFISSVVSIVQHVDFGVFVKRLAISAVVFLILGFAARFAIWYTFKPAPLEEEDEGEGEEGDKSDVEDITVDESVMTETDE